VDTTTSERDPAEAVRIALLVIGLAFNAWVMWDYIRERPEVMIARRRLEQWWHRRVVAPEQRARDLRRMEGETIMEAMTIVEGT